MKARMYIWTRRLPLQLFSQLSFIQNNKYIQDKNSAKTLPTFTAAVHTSIRVIFGSVHKNAIIPGSLATQLPFKLPIPSLVSVWSYLFEVRLAWWNFDETNRNTMRPNHPIRGERIEC